MELKYEEYKPGTMSVLSLGIMSLGFYDPKFFHPGLGMGLGGIGENMIYDNKIIGEIKNYMYELYCYLNPPLWILLGVMNRDPDSATIGAKILLAGAASYAKKGKVYLT